MTSALAYFTVDELVDGHWVIATDEMQWLLCIAVQIAMHASHAPAPL